MNEEFKQYYTPSSKEFEEIWSNALIAFDSSFILSTYRCSNTAKEEIFDALKKIEDRIWLPYQVGFEYHKNRLDAIRDAKNEYSKFLKGLNHLKDGIKNEYRSPFFSDNLTKDFFKIYDQFTKECEIKRCYFEDLIFDDSNKDFFSEIFKGKIGNEISSADKKKIYDGGKERFKSKTPPGYKDDDKPIPDKYGDLVIWEELLLKASLAKKPIIFVTDDRKEDWWLIHEGKTLGPRPELLAEFQNRTNQSCYLYQPSSFLKYFGNHFDKQIDSKVIEELKDKPPIETEDGIKIKISVTYSNRIDVKNFIDYLSRMGYDVFYRFKADLKGQALIIISLPRFSDIERRLREVHLARLEDFSLTLADYQIV